MNSELLQDFPEYKNLEATDEFTQFLFDHWIYEDFVDIIELLLTKFNTTKEVVNKLKEFLEAEISSQLLYEDDELTEGIINIAKNKMNTKLVAIQFLSDYFFEYYNENLYEKYSQYYAYNG